jgi:hypothetical protein
MISIIIISAYLSVQNLNNIFLFSRCLICYTNWIVLHTCHGNRYCTQKSLQFYYPISG